MFGCVAKDSSPAGRLCRPHSVCKGAESIACCGAGMGTGSITMWACLSLAPGAVAGEAMDPTTGATATTQVRLQDPGGSHIVIGNQRSKSQVQSYS